VFAWVLAAGPVRQLRSKDPFRPAEKRRGYPRRARAVPGTWS